MYPTNMAEAKQTMMRQRTKSVAPDDDDIPTLPCHAGNTKYSLHANTAQSQLRRAQRVSGLDGRIDYGYYLVIAVHIL